MKRIIQQIIERNTEGNYLLSNSDKEKMVSELLDLFDGMQYSSQGADGYVIEHLINDTYQLIHIIDGSVYYQGSKRDCQDFLKRV